MKSNVAFVFKFTSDYKSESNYSNFSLIGGLFKGTGILIKPTSYKIRGSLISNVQVYDAKENALRIERNLETNKTVYESFVTSCVFATSKLAGIYVNVTDICIANSVVASSEYHGVILKGAGGVTIEGNHVWGNNVGIYLENSMVNTIYGNFIEDNSKAGMVLAGSSKNLICSNRFIWNGCEQYHSISGARADLEIHDYANKKSEHNHIHGNLFEAEHNRYGKVAQFGVVLWDNSTNNTIVSNKFIGTFEVENIKDNSNGSNVLEPNY